MHEHHSGFALLDALAALALVALIALGSAELLSLSHARLGEARRLREAKALATRVLDELSLLGWHALPPALGAGPSESNARADSARGELPSAWADALAAAGLREGRLEVELEGLAAAGRPAPFEQSLGIRMRVRVSWIESRAPRQVVLATGRF